MKKLSVVICVFLMLFMAIGSCVADTVDKALFENLDGYKYDKFNKTWSYHQAYVHKFSDANVVIGLQIEGGSEKQVPPALYCWIRNKQNTEVLMAVTKLMILVGDNMYTFDKVYPSDSSSVVYLGAECKEFIEDLAAADSITVRLVVKTGSMDEEITGSDYTDTLKVAAQALLDSNVFSMIDEEYKQITDLFIPTKE